MTGAPRILVTCSRRWKRWSIVREALAKVHANYPNAILVHGDPNGRRAEFERLGWIVRSRQDPALIPARIWHENRCDWFLLLEDGSVELAPWPERDGRHPDDLEVPRVDPGLDGAA